MQKIPGVKHAPLECLHKWAAAALMYSDGIGPWEATARIQSLGRNALSKLIRRNYDGLPQTMKEELLPCDSTKQSRY